MSLPVSGRSLSAGDMVAPLALSLALEETVMLALMPSGETSNAKKDSLIDAGRSTGWSKDGAA